MLHEFGDTQIGDMGTETFSRFMNSELDFYLNSETGKKVIADQYVGLPYEDIRS
jgi:p-hydroxybenzoate 3-monooxygenase